MSASTVTTNTFITAAQIDNIIGAINTEAAATRRNAGFSRTLPTQGSKILASTPAQAKADIATLNSIHTIPPSYQYVTIHTYTGVSKTLASASVSFSSGGMIKASDVNTLVPDINALSTQGCTNTSNPCCNGQCCNAQCCNSYFCTGHDHYNTCTCSCQANGCSCNNNACCNSNCSCNTVCSCEFV